MAPVCRFWQQGTCRNGNNCRFEHPSKDQGFSSNNRFASLQNTTSSNPRNNNGFHTGGGAGGASAQPFALDKAAIVTDLSNERPQWILSAYGPGRGAPAQLFGGPIREQSFEEMRLLHYAGLASGNPQQAAQEADKLLQASEQQIQTALNNVDGAIKFILDSERDHPNRIDICRASTKSEGGYQPPGQNPISQGTTPGAFPPPLPTSNPFGAPSQTATAPGFGQPSGAFGSTPTAAPSGGFGQPSALGQTPSSFAASSGGFGQPSALGQKPSPFGAPSQPAFGAPSQPGAGGAFGQPSQMGQRPSPFAPSTSSSGTTPFSAFANNPSPFVQQPQTTSSFGTPSQPAPSIGFGQPSQPPTSSGFPPAQSNPFGAPTGRNPSPFTSTASSQPNAFGQPTAQHPSPFAPANPGAQPSPFDGVSASPFGQPSPAPANPFQSSTPGANPFASNQAQPNISSPFTNGASTAQPPQPATSNPFQSSQNPPSASPFATAGPSASSNGFIQANPLAQPAVKEGAQFNGTTQWPKHPDLNMYSSLTSDGKRLAMFKGRRVVYHKDDPGYEDRGRWKRIWCPSGFPFRADTEMDGSYYNENVEAAYKYLRQNNSFEGGVMPLIPPKREWCKFDF